MGDTLHPASKRILTNAAMFCLKEGKPVSVNIIFHVLLHDEDKLVRHYLRDHTGLDMAALDAELSIPQNLAHKEGTVPVEAPVLEMMKIAGKESGSELVRPVHIFMGMMQVDSSPIRKKLAKEGIQWTDGMRQHLLRVQKTADAVVDIDNKIETGKGGGKPVVDPRTGKKMRPSWNDDVAAFFAEIGARDMTLAALNGELPAIVGREKQVKRLLSILCRQIKRNAVITGEAGTGKTAMVELLSQRIASGDVPDALKDKIVVSIPVGDIVAGTKYRGEFEERMKKLVAACASDPRLIIFMDEFHLIVGAGETKGGSMDASNLIKPALTSGQMCLIGATTHSEYLKFVKKDRAFTRRFQELALPEPTNEELRNFVSGRRPGLEKFHNAEVTNAAVSAAVYLARRYLEPRGMSIVDGALTLIDGACSTLRLQKDGGSEAAQDALAELKKLRLDIDWTEREKDQSGLEAMKARAEELEALVAAETPKVEEGGDEGKSASAQKVVVLGGERIVIDKAQIEEELTASTDIPVTQPVELLLRFPDNMASTTVGRADATASLSGILKARDLFTEDKPIASILVLGPTGTGKTWWARQVAKALGIDIERLDMSEYQDKSAIGKLTGGVPIYVGFDQEGTLTEPVRRKPYLVLLLDEIEKAHRDLYSLLLQVMDYGKLKDGHGRKIDFVNVLLIMTTNVGAKEASAQAIVGDSVGKSKQKTPAETAKQTQDRVIGAAQKVFSPEFLNRLDLMLVFPALTHEDIVGITKQQVVPLVQQLAETKGIELVIDPSVVDYLAVEGYSTEFGARQLARKIMQLIKVPLADRVLAKEFGQGDKVEAFMNKGAVDFRKIA